MLMLSRLRSNLLIRTASSHNFVEKAYALIDDAKFQGAKAEEVNKAWLKKENDLRLPKELYKHPYCTEDHPITLHPRHTFRIVMELLGPEQVSPHFQSVLEYSKWYNYFFIGLIFTVAMRSHHNHAWGYVVLNMHYGFEMWVYCFFYYFMQSTAMVFPAPWKQLWKSYNLDSILESVFENEENLALETRKPSLAQVDYLRVHKEYLGTKAKLMEIHLENSRVLLKKHTYERALNILKATDRFEKDNMSRVLRDALDKAVQKLGQDISGSEAKDIKKLAFQSALIGIRKGKMTYENDPLLPRLLNYIEDFKTKAEKMTEKEQAELLGLSKEQKAVIALSDKKAEESFTHTLPAIKHPRILNSKKFKSLSA
ncbi:hypothetical protein SteCoe_33323 [Stentor coeruleus]|uniref:Uncharacterized protein n=1 Tax=Stentor coeruleus TaxID=5963 RepID=A0A1R2AX09_9CILI|nr:hypothetical protein SteCoe_33323 [Stentor coeruleus]